MNRQKIVEDILFISKHVEGNCLIKIGKDRIKLASKRPLLEGYNRDMENTKDHFVCFLW